MREAIQKAIEGGYEALPQRAEFRRIEIEEAPKRWYLHFYDLEGMQHDFFTYQTGDTLLDPLFWQCLGKALGWKNRKGFEYTPGGTKVAVDYGEGYLHYWHRFLDHLADSKDIDTFFKDLLSKGRE